MKRSALLALAVLAAPGLAGAKSCPPGMVAIEETYCIDPFEASLVEMLDKGVERPYPFYLTVDGKKVRAVSRAGAVPQGYISGAQAQAACRASHKRLCTAEEWVKACRGPGGYDWGYAAQRRGNACNDVRATHPVVDLFKTDKGVWDEEHMNDPRLLQLPNTVKAAGASPQCTNDYGVFDMVGNLEEWVDDPAGTFLGGYFMGATANGPGCAYTTTAHDFGYHDYSTGFRCCADPS